MKPEAIPIAKRGATGLLAALLVAAMLLLPGCTTRQRDVAAFTAYEKTAYEAIVQAVRDDPAGEGGGTYSTTNENDAAFYHFKSNPKRDIQYLQTSQSLDGELYVVEFYAQKGIANWRGVVHIDAASGTVYELRHYHLTPTEEGLLTLPNNEVGDDPGHKSFEKQYVVIKTTVGREQRQF